jgi:hypothetical protein
MQFFDSGMVTIFGWRDAVAAASRRGCRNILMVGGVENFNRTILNGSPLIFSGSRRDNDVRQFRESERLEIHRMRMKGGGQLRLSRGKSRFKGRC